MMSKLSTYIFLLLAAQLLCSATLRLHFAGLDENGHVFPQGSGYWEEQPWQRPLVLDSGELRFAAQITHIPLDDVSQPEKFRALYDKIPDAAQSSIISPGHDSFALTLGQKWYKTHWAFGANSYAVLEEQTSGTGNVKLELKQLVDGGPSISLDSENITLQTLQMHQGGTLLALSAADLAQPLFYEINQGQLAKRTDPPMLPGYNHKGIAISPEADEIYFCSTDNLTDNDDYQEGMLSLFALQLSSGEFTRISKLGQPGMDAKLHCAKDSKSLVFCHNGEKILFAWQDNAGDWQTQSLDSPENLEEPDEPQINADGRFVVFSAKMPGSDERQIFRYDRQREKLLQVSQNSSAQAASADCLVPNISPNGRYVVFVSAANNLGQAGITQPQVWLADLGPSLAASASLDLFQEQRLELPFNINAITGSTELKIEFSDAAAVSGTFYDVNDNVLLPGMPYPASSLPWYYKAANDAIGELALILSVCEGEFYDSISLNLRIHEKDSALLSCVSLNNQGEFVSGQNRIFSDASCSEDGELLAFVTRLPILIDNKNNVSHAYLRDIRKNKLLLLSQGMGATVTKVCLSGNGRLLYFISDSKLWKYDVAQAQRSEFISGGIDNVKPALNHDASILAYGQGGKVYVQIKGLDEPELILSQPCSALQLNRDGSVLLMLTEDKNLFAYFNNAGETEPLLLTEQVAEFSLNQSGSELLYRSNKQLFKHNIGTSQKTELELPAELEMMDLKNILLSGNGRYIAWLRNLELDGETFAQQQFIYELSTGKERLVSQNAGRQPGNGQASSLFACFSASGHRLFFASEASNLVPGDGNSAQDLFMASFQESDKDTLTLQNDQLAGTEDESAVFPLQLHSKLGNALVPLLETERSAKDAALRLLGPVPGREGYALQYIPKANYCGEDSCEIRVWDGSKLSAKFTLNIDLANVNDPPVAVAQDELTLHEGELLSVNLLDYADDPDLHNEREQDRDALSFTLPADSPGWLNLQGNMLSASPGHDLVSHAEGEKNFVLTVIVSDQAGETVETQVKLKIIDVNRPPTLSLQQNNILQTSDNIMLDAELFTASDPDLEDQENLDIILRHSGQDILIAKFPHVFAVPTEAKNELTLEFYAKDSQGEMSEPCQLRLLLRRVGFSAAELWGYVPGNEPDEESSWRDVRRGWNLLALPWAINNDELLELFGQTAQPRAWNSAKQAYQSVENLFAGQGFWIYLENLENINKEEIILSGGRLEAPPLQTGWNLIGANWQSQDDSEQSNIFELQQDSWSKSETLQAGQARWIFLGH